YEGTYKYDDFTELNGQYTLKPDVPAFSGVTNTQPGYPKFKDINGDGVIDANDRTIIGRGDPIHTGGFTNNFTYKDFDLSIFMQWSYGNDILNANKLMFESGFNKKKNLNQFASFANRWTPDNPESNIPRVSNASSNMVFSSRVIEDGSFLRLKNITLGYTLPTAIAKKMYLESMRVYVAANNLITFTSYSGYDPEVSVRNSALTPGLDFSSYPRSTSFHFGVNLEF
ncbi:MAG: SusC/RagA family TonB-linked outer membrane protein, partial [Bacteroides sp.]